MKIRRIRDDDYPKIARLRRQTIRTVNAKDYSDDIIQDWTEQTTTKTLRDSAHLHKRWVAIEDHEIIGFCDHTSECEISRIYVHKDHLRRGIGSRLLAVMEYSLHKQGCRFATLSSTITARPFYEKKGYVTLRKTRYRTRRKTSTAYSMSKKLK